MSDSPRVVSDKTRHQIEHQLGVEYEFVVLFVTARQAENFKTQGDDSFKWKSFFAVGKPKEA